MYTQLATRAAGSEDAYEIALSGLNKTLKEVDDSFKKNLKNEKSRLEASPTGSDILEPTSTNEVKHKVKGIKKTEGELFC